jgi:hypothetical protein
VQVLPKLPQLAGPATSTYLGNAELGERYHGHTGSARAIPFSHRLLETESWLKPAIARWCTSGQTSGAHIHGKSKYQAGGPPPFAFLACSLAHLPDGILSEQPVL